MSNLTELLAAFPSNTDDVLVGTKYEQTKKMDAAQMWWGGDEELFADRKTNATIVILQARVIDELMGALENARNRVDYLGLLGDERHCTANYNTFLPKYEEALTLARLLKEKTHG